MSSGIGISHLSQFQNALNEVSKVMDEGEKTHEKDSWKCKNPGLHSQHAYSHIFYITESFIEKNDYDSKFSELNETQKRNFDLLIKDFSHAATRCLMALELLLRQKNEK